MRSNDFLQAAIDVQNQRATEYDQPEGERSMGRTVQAFNAITGRELTEAEGWLFMQVLKDVRQWSAKGYHHDSALDGVSYSALKAEALHGEQKTDTPSELPMGEQKFGMEKALAECFAAPDPLSPSDPRMWEPGDRLTYIGTGGRYYSAGESYEVVKLGSSHVYLSDNEAERPHAWGFSHVAGSFQWVSRP